MVNSRMENAMLRPFRGRLLEEALGHGLPGELEAPLRFLITGELTPEDQRRVAHVESLRAELAASDRTVRDDLEDRTSVRRLAVVVSVDQRFGTLLYLCAKSTQARSILELGSCVGIGMSYMASAGCRNLVSADGEPDRAQIASRTVQRVKPDAEVVVGRFDDVLDDILSRFPAGIDMAWIDGHHQREPTLRYLDRIKPALNAGALLIFDDIGWSAEMRDTWRILQRADGFSATVDLKRVGIGIWRAEGTKPRAFDLRGIYGRPRIFHRALFRGELSPQDAP